jgi:hypothetical protein
MEQERFVNETKAGVRAANCAEQRQRNAEHPGQESKWKPLSNREKALGIVVVICSQPVLRFS